MSKPIDDEWWTTDTVCALLKVGKRSLWNLRKDPTKSFPAAIKPGGKVILFRAADVRAWLASRPSVEERQGDPANRTPPLRMEAKPAPIPELIVSRPQGRQASSAPAPLSKRKRSKRKPTGDQLSLF